MPNVRNMEERFRSHLARVSGKAIEKEMNRIDQLRWDGKVSSDTAFSLKASAAIRLAYLANA